MPFGLQQIHCQAKAYRKAVPLDCIDTENKDKWKKTNQLTFSVKDELWDWNTIESGFNFIIIWQHKFLNVMIRMAKLQNVGC